MTRKVFGRTGAAHRPLNRGARAVRFIAAAFAVVLVASLWPGTSANAEDVATDPTEAQFLQLTNDARVQQGLAPLKADPQLSGVARTWATKMRDDGAISHNMALPNFVTADWSKLGENVGSGPDAGVIQQKFLESAAHYKNIMDADFDVVGIGVARNGDLIYVTLDFMGLQDAPQPSVKPGAAVPQVLSFKAVATAKATVSTTVPPRRPTPTTKKRKR